VVRMEGLRIDRLSLKLLGRPDGQDSDDEGSDDEGSDDERGDEA
jgi:hypothetical protein